MQLHLRSRGWSCCILPFQFGGVSKSKLSIQEAFSILGLPFGASWDDIRSAYRRLAKEWHPDASSHPHAKERFARIAAAYKRLEDWNTGGRTSHTFQSSAVQSERRRREMRDEARRRDLKERRLRMLRRAKMKKMMEEKENAKGYRSAIVLIVSVLLVYFGVMGVKSIYRNYRINSNTATAYGMVIGQEPSFTTYLFEVNGEAYREEVRVDYTLEENRAENGLPIRIKDRYLVEYDKDDPTYHRIDFNSPDLETHDSHLKMGESQLRFLFRNIFGDMSAHDANYYAHCAILVIYDHYKDDGICNLLYYNAHPLRNWSHNEGSFSDMIEEEEFHKCFEYCNLVYQPPVGY